MKKTLIMWSGGIDSTYVLAHLLKETDDEVFAHHIYLVNHERRHVEENNAIRSLIPKLKAIRNFNFSETMIDNSRLPNAGSFDMAEVTMRAGVVTKSFYLAGIEFDRWLIGTHEAEGHNWTRWEWIYPHFLGAKWSPDGKIPKTEWELYPMISKSDEIKYLTQAGLIDGTWSCRTPINGVPCNQCKTCNEIMSAFFEQLTKGTKTNV